MLPQRQLLTTYNSQLEGPVDQQRIREELKLVGERANGKIEVGEVVDEVGCVYERVVGVRFRGGEELGCMVFHAKLFFVDGYPAVPPILMFMPLANGTVLPHPNVYENGEFCHGALDPQFYRPEMRIHAILTLAYNCLHKPSLANPANPSAAEHLLKGESLQSAIQISLTAKSQQPGCK